MADLSVTPVSTGIKPQQQMSLGDLMNIASSAQAYQQAQQLNPLAVQKATADVQSAQQTAQGGAVDLQQKQTGFKEAQAIKEAIASNPDQFMTNGKFDTSKLNRVIPQIAPLTADEQIDRYTKVANNQSLADSAKLGLTKDQKSIFGSTISALGYAGVDDPAKYSEAIQNIIKAHGNDKDMVDLGTAYTKILGLSDPGAHISESAKQLGQSLMSQPEQYSAFAHKASLTPTGQVQVTKPAVAGNEPSITLGQAQGQNPNLGVQEIGGVKYNVTTAPDGSLQLKPITLAQTPAAGGSAPAARTGNKLFDEPFAPHPANQPVQYGPGEEEAAKTGAQLKSTVGAQVTPAKQGIQAAERVISLADTASPTFLGQAWNKGKSALVGNTELNELAKNIAQLQVQNAAAMGVTTDQQAANVAKATGDIAITPDALRDVARNTKASSLALVDFNKAFANYIAKRGPVTGNANAVAFRDAWGNNYDPKIFLVRDINASNMSKTQKELELSRITKGLSDDKLRELQTKALNIKRLERGDYE